MRNRDSEILPLTWHNLEMDEPKLSLFLAPAAMSLLHCLVLKWSLLKRFDVKTCFSITSCKINQYNWIWNYSALWEVSRFRIGIIVSCCSLLYYVWKALLAVEWFQGKRYKRIWNSERRCWLCWFHKNESNIPKKSTELTQANQVAVTEHDTSVGTMALMSNFSGDLKELDNKTNSMMVKTSNKNVRGQIVYECTLCGREAGNSDLKKHIEANHLEGISIPCQQCEKTFRSRNLLAVHKHSYHKRNFSP